MSQSWIRGILMGTALLVLAACGGEDVAPSGDPPILGGVDSLPKELATVVLTATPTPVLAGGEAVVVAGVTPTPGPPLPTPTLTPYVGFFLGEPTSESGAAVPNMIPTLAPYVFDAAGGNPINSAGLVPGSGGGCTIPVATTFAKIYSGVQARLGCPVSGAVATQLVTQPFERGDLYWRNTRQIYALARSGQFWLVADMWQDGMPADDPALVPPGGLLQPVRGFGLAWRSTPAIRDALGWGTASEVPYNATWQDFERGALFTTNSGQVYAVFPAEGQHSGPLAP